MEDRETKVWQRVFAGPGGQGPMELRPLIRWAAESAAVYRGLMTGGKHRELLRKLYEEELANLACLRGMAILSGGAQETPGKLSIGREPAEKALEKCYHRTRRAMVEYTARSAEPEYGAVFRTLADRAQEQCALIAQLIGTLGR
ncbi:MAG: hypothetical protein IJ001_12755 [Oscillospiraceae bacterium]|nr:hypothetical protein [Oscillospiraceae bacterium]MBQ8835775.1 hypothetical protein [Oscillospiraceae bacterium]